MPPLTDLLCYAVRHFGIHSLNSDQIVSSAYIYCILFDLLGFCIMALNGLCLRQYVRGMLKAKY